MKKNLKKMEVKRNIGLSYYLSLATSLASIFVVIAGLDSAIKLKSALWAILALVFINLLGALPLDKLRQKQGLESKLEINLDESGWFWFALGVIFILLGILSCLTFNIDFGNSLFAVGLSLMLYSVWGRKGRIRNRKKLRKRNQEK